MSVHQTLPEDTCVKTDAVRKCYVIPVRYQCSAACPFCITKSYSPAKIRETLRLDAAFYRSVSFIRDAGVRVYEFTGGGEPTLNRHLADLVAAVRASAPTAYVKLYTNGGQLPRISSIDEVNISRAVLDDVANATAMRFRRPPPSLVEIVSHWRARGVGRIRLSVPLTRDGVASPQDLRRLVDGTDTLVDGYVVRPMYPGTPNVESLYAAPFAFEHPKVELDLESCAMRPNLVLGSDGRLYEDFALSSLVL